MDKISRENELLIKAKVLDHLIDHLRGRSDVQNIDLMNLSGFCRNCLSKWYLSAAEDRGVEMNYDKAREVIYGIPYSEWKDRYQSEVK